LLRQGIMPHIVTYSALIRACGKVKDLPKALELCDDFQNRGITPNIITYSVLINACEKGRDLLQALYFSKCMQL
jgi:pentatricopeptide repeat protein